MKFKHLLPRTPAKKFTQYDGTFQEYIDKMRKVISDGRLDLTGSDAPKIVDANCPFEWQPKNPNNNGVLLIHGLSDSPFMMRDLATHFVNQGYLVRTVLLPGHGTVPGDMLNISPQDWLNCVAYAIFQTAPIVDKLFLCGFSLGAGLSILNAKSVDNIAGIIALAPGLKAAHRYSFIPKIHRLFSWISHGAKWYLIRDQISHVKYYAHPFHSASLAMKIMRTVRKTKLETPTFFTISSEDETVKPHYLINYFLKHRNPKSRFIYYTNQPVELNDPRFENRPSAHPEENIIDFSHIAIPISPDNPYLGRHGKFIDYFHYEHRENNHENKEEVLGAISAHNITNFHLQRLTYNPDFSYMTQSIDKFMSEL